MSPQESDAPHSLAGEAVCAVMLYTWVFVVATALACCVPMAFVSMVPGRPD
jgi:hypothetical protein